MWTSTPSCWHRAPENRCDFLGNRGVLVLRVCLLVGSWVGLVTRTTSNYQLGILRPILILQRGWKWSSCLSMPIWWSLHKNPESMGFRELLGCRTSGGASSGVCLRSGWSPSHTEVCLTHLFHLDVHLYPLLYPVIKNL